MFTQKVGFFTEHSCFKDRPFTYIYTGTLLPGLGDLFDLLYEVFCFGLGFFFALSMSALHMNAIYYSQLDHFGAYKFII